MTNQILITLTLLLTACATSPAAQPDCLVYENGVCLPDPYEGATAEDSDRCQAYAERKTGAHVDDRSEYNEALWAAFDNCMMAAAHGPKAAQSLDKKAR